MLCSRRYRIRSDSSLSPAQQCHPQVLSLPTAHSFDSPAAAERLADYTRASPLPTSPETDSGSESLRVPHSMPEVSQDSNLVSLTTSVMDKMKVSPPITSNRQQSNQEYGNQKQVKVQIGSKMKGTGQDKKKRIPSANLDLPRAFLNCKETGETVLDLSRSNISVLPATLRDLTHLKELYLYSNRLATLPPEIGCLVNLSTLSLSENVITSLPDQLANLQNLRVLDCRHNRLIDIPAVLYRVSSLTTIYMRFNRIRVVDPELGNLTNLTNLSIRENQITSLPPTIGQLRRLHTFDCSYNQLEHLPAEIGECRQLVQLDLQHNKLLDLPAEIGELTQLQRLGLRYNQLDTGNIPRTLANCVHLEEFNIGKTRPSSIQPLDLCLENNCVAALPDGLLAALDKITSITLSRNQFTAYPAGGPAQFVNITALNMEHNLCDR